MVAGLSRRAFAGAHDLRVMQEVSLEVWRVDPARLDAEGSFGQLAWSRGGHGASRQLFERDGQPAGWAWVAPGYRRIRRPDVWDDAPASLSWQVHPADPEPDEVVAAILDWAEAQPGGPLVTSCAEADLGAAAALASRGYSPKPDEPFGLYLRRRLDVLDRPAPADGYSFTTMAEYRDLEGRVDGHRRAWYGSTMSAEWFAGVMATWPYRADLDCLAVAPDGSVAASAIAWYAPSIGVGEFEPVGTVAEHRGAGLAPALLRFALHRLRQAGASTALVGARGDDDYPGPRKVYRSVGFELIGRQVVVSAAG